MLISCSKEIRNVYYNYSFLGTKAKIKFNKHCYILKSKQSNLTGKYRFNEKGNIKKIVTLLRLVRKNPQSRALSRPRRNERMCVTLLGLEPKLPG